MLNGGNENLLERALALSEDVFLYYLPGYILGEGNTNSPFREDKIPSFSVRWSKGKWRFKDFGNSDVKGDVVDFIMLLHNLTFDQAVSRVVEDFGTNSLFGREGSHVVRKSKVQKGNSVVELDVKSKLWATNDLNWWKEFGITIDTLNKYNVKPCSHIFINKHPILCKEPTYVFRENKDGVESIKIYQPLAKSFKWLNNHKWEVVQGWTQLPEKGELLIVTKGLKDVLTLHELGYSSVAPQSETSFLKAHILKQLLKRFDKIIILYDNDVPGLAQAKKYSEQYSLPYMYLPLEGPKDISDYYKANGKEETIKILKQLL